jgi:SIR2-like domain
MDAINWEILLHELESGKCILCVGADIFSESIDERTEKKLATTLRKNSEALGIRVYDDGWFHYLQNRDELSTWFTIKNFYENNLSDSATPIFTDISALPFHLVLNFSPDYKMRDAYKAAGKPHEFACLYKNPESGKTILKEGVEGTKEKPLLFNMLGEIEDKDSLVMTYDDLFGYMAAIFEYKRMPQAVKLKIQNATHFIFIGMPLDKWYFHLFMRVMNLHRGRGKSKRFAATYTVDAGNASFCEEQYTLTFVQDNIAAFIKLLKNRWEDAQKKTSNGTPLSIFDRWRAMVKTSEDVAIRSFFKDVKPYLDKYTAFKNDALLLEMQWNGFMSMSFETVMAQNAMKTQIISGVLGLIDRIEQEDKNP